MKPDELWEKYSAPEAFGNTIYEIMTEGSFLAALTEYGEAVRAENAKLCEALDASGLPAPDYRRVAFPRDCAAAISKMELP